MASVARSQSWADFVDEVVTDADDQSTEALAVVDEIVLSEEPIKEGMKLKKDVAGVTALADDGSMGGSALHKSGRCKPCAFFHTKGCQNDKNCQFCHLCPPGEKQRRKRLRERMCEKLGQCLQRPPAFDQVDQRRLNSGHRRQASGASLGETSTQSTCSGWTKFSHSRQSSSSSVTDSTGVVGTPMRGMPHMHQMLPVFHFAQNVMPLMGDGVESPMPTPSNAQKEMTTTPLALAQVVPLPGQPSQGAPMPAAAPGQMAPCGPPQWQNNGAVQYALVQVAVPMPQHQQYAADPSIPYGWYAQQPYPQMAVIHGENAQWGFQAGANYAQPTF